DEEHPEQIRYLLIPYDKSESSDALRGFVEANDIFLRSLKYRAGNLFHPEAQIMVVVGDGHSQSDNARLLKIPGVGIGDITKLVDDITGTHSTTHRGQRRQKSTRANGSGGTSQNTQRIIPFAERGTGDDDLGL